MVSRSGLFRFAVWIPGPAAVRDDFSIWRNRCSNFWTARASAVSGCTPLNRATFTSVKRISPNSSATCAASCCPTAAVNSASSSRSFRERPPGPPSRSGCAPPAPKRRRLSTDLAGRSARHPGPMIEPGLLLRTLDLLPVADDFRAVGHRADRTRGDDAFHLFANPRRHLQIKVSLFGMHLGENRMWNRTSPILHTRARQSRRQWRRPAHRLLRAGSERWSTQTARDPGAPVRPLSRSMIRINSSIAAEAGSIQEFPRLLQFVQFCGELAFDVAATRLASLSETRDT